MVVRLDWTDDLNTGIDMLDRQHIMIVRAINLLGLGAEHQSDEELMAAIFSTLVDTVVTHFDYEEQVFEAANYPETEAHKRTHAAFVERASALREKLILGGEGCNEELIVLITWLKEHILGSDKKYIPFVRTDGAQIRQAG